MEVVKRMNSSGCMNGWWLPAALAALLVCGVTGLRAQSEAAGVPATWTELTEARTASSRVFADEEGRRHLQQTAGYFHYRDPEGNWQPIQEVPSHCGDGQWGLMQTTLPMHVNTATGESVMQLTEQGALLRFGISAALEQITGDGVIAEIVPASAPASHHADAHRLSLNGVFPAMNRIQEMNYWSLRTDYLVSERPALQADTRWLGLADEYQVPAGWELTTSDGEWEENRWHGMLELKDAAGEVRATFSTPVFYDNAGKAIRGTYQWEITPAGYRIRILVPAEWLLDENRAYPVVLDPTISNTYASGLGVQDWMNTFNANCQATMGLTLPAGPSLSVTNSSIQYTIRSMGTITSSGFTTYYAAGFEQRSRVGVGTNWTPVQNGFGNSMSIQDVPYNIPNSPIANGCYPGGTVLTFIWQGYQTFFPYPGPPLANVAGCTTTYHQLLANTWVVTVTYNVFQLTANTNPSAANVCSGDNAQVSLSSSPPGASFTWTVTQTGATGANAGAGNTINQTLFATAQAAGTVVYTITPTLNGCLGTPAPVTVTVNPIYTDIDEFAFICPGQTHTYQNVTYSVPGQYPVVLTSVSGCDSIVTLNLELMDAFTSTLNESICQGESYTFSGSDYSAPGTYTANLISTAGCDSIVTLNLTVNPVYSLSFEAEVCQGQTYAYAGNVYDATGDYPVMFQSAQGCDSLMTLQLTITPAYSQTVDAEICNGESYLFEGSLYDEAGTYTEVYQTQDGCDSLIVLNLTVHPTPTTSVNESFCQGDTFWYDGQSYTSGGAYPLIYQTVHGCDSLVNLILTELPRYEFTINEEICEGEVYMFDGFAFGETGTYLRELQTAAGCDSIFVLNLTVHPVPVVDIGDSYVICSNESVTLSGPQVVGNFIWSTGQLAPSITVSQTGTYELTVVTSEGCTASDEAAVTVLPSPESPLNTDFVFCTGGSVELDAGNPGSSYLWSTGQTDQTITVYTPGYYTVQITSQLGCEIVNFAQVIEYCEPVVYVPNAFTPNMDGINDYFQPSGKNLADYELTVFNRWGEPIFFSDAIEKGWDGSHLGGEHYVQDQIAHWIIRYRVYEDTLGRVSEWRKLSGHVLILR
jgi:gliding motility-associated-like protein